MSNHRNNNSNHGGNSPNYHSSPDNYNHAGDGYRQQASVHAAKRAEYMQQSQDAWHKGDKALAKQLSDKGKHEGFDMDACNAKAAEAYFNDNNDDNFLGDIDLHGLHVDEAIRYTTDRINLCRQRGLNRLIIIVGKGNHSVDHVRKLAPAIEQLMQQLHLKIWDGYPNGGCFTADLHDSPQGGVKMSGQPPQLSDDQQRLAKSSWKNAGAAASPAVLPAANNNNNNNNQQQQQQQQQQAQQKEEVPWWKQLLACCGL